MKFPVRLEGLAYKHSHYSSVRMPPSRRALPAAYPCRVGASPAATGRARPMIVTDLTRAHTRTWQYEPELFPGLIYRMVQPKIVLLIFVSGKVVLTGGKVRASPAPAAPARRAHASCA